MRNSKSNVIEQKSCFWLERFTRSMLISYVVLFHHQERLWDQSASKQDWGWAVPGCSASKEDQGASGKAIYMTIPHECFINISTFLQSIMCSLLIRPVLKSWRRKLRLSVLLVPRLRSRELISPENLKRSVKGLRRLVEPLLLRLRLTRSVRLNSRSCVVTLRSPPCSMKPLLLLCVRSRLTV